MLTKCLKIARSTVFATFETTVFLAVTIALTGGADTAAGEKGGFDFPTDHGLHREFATEWWYLTANLENSEGEQFGIQFTLFAQKVGDNHRLWFAHAAASSARHFVFAERYARDDMGNAGITNSPWRAFMDHWCLCSSTTSPLPAELVVEEDDFAYRMQLQEANYLTQGDAGKSPKNARGDVTTYYYSAPFIEISGELVIDGKANQVRGEAWFDREWSNTLISGQNIGWDWLSLRLEEKQALLIFWFHDDSGAHLSAYLLDRDGGNRPLNTEEIHWQPRRHLQVGDRRYPIASTLKIPSLGVDIRIEPLNDLQYLSTQIPYWEGAVRARGSHQGRGYLELFGRRAD